MGMHVCMGMEGGGGLAAKQYLSVLIKFIIRIQILYYKQRHVIICPNLTTLLQIYSPLLAFQPLNDLPQ